ncbi:hypothetical protein, partial [Candidatus Anaplasma sp. TIGMIC]|uniref:hypothetical protein n=1 Tax=Candidatus Anaplasma sp. TIGMIC TaxID=3020713 RepID=UPI002330231E
KDLRLLERFHNEESCRREVGYAMTGTKEKGQPPADDPPVTGCPKATRVNTETITAGQRRICPNDQISLTRSRRFEAT